MATAQRNQPQATSKSNGGGRTTPSMPTTTSAPARDSIAARAYEIWLESGRPNGKDQEHWFQAEREIRSGTVRKSAR